MTDIETERRAIVAEVFSRMNAAGEPIDHDTIAAEIEKHYPGFALRSRA